MPSNHKPKPNLEIIPFNLDRDLPSISQIWSAALPYYALPPEELAQLLPQDNAHHFICTINSEPVGFCLSYTNRHPSSSSASAYIAVLAVHPDAQGKGVGAALLDGTIARHRENFGPCRLELGSSFPRFWPGVPVSLPSTVSNGGDQKTSHGVQSNALDFFVNRGFKMRPDPPRSVDMYRDIRNFSLDEEGNDCVRKAREAGLTFEPLKDEGYAACMEGQRRNFANNAAWVDMYTKLSPITHPSSIMTAFSPSGTQIGWTLMLAPSSPILSTNWAMPSVCGPRTGLIGCVGVDSEYRGKGLGLALIAHAINDLKKRGVEGVFIDWVAIEGFYEKLGFEVWARYRVGDMEVE
ncbi:acyl-CoA N-acyltransferase [Aspergillus unguis]